MNDLLKIITKLLVITAPAITKLIKSTVVPFLKRRLYERADKKVDKMIVDLAQNAEKIKDEKDINKKSAYIEATRLGVDTLKKMAEKLNRAADEIEKVLV